jgi:7-cyano-7-deazaguanine reductase
MKDIPLGKESSIPIRYDPSVLIPLSRLDSRTKSGLQEYTKYFYGRDYWTSYETSWLNGNGIPRNKILNVSYSCESKFFIESKSFKLYLYSLNNKKFDSTKEVVSLIKNDLETALKSEVEVELINQPREIEKNWTSLDSLEIDNIDSHPNSLVLEPNNQDEVSEEVSCSLFRSLCPVTAQPDWATVYISYKGNGIEKKSLLRYLISYRNHQGFHEECVERIFLDITKRIRIKELSVRANFLRRGGIEINPVRTTPGLAINIFREIRQ